MVLNTLPSVFPYSTQQRGSLPDPVEVELPGGMESTTERGALKTELPDGSVVIDINPLLNRRPKSEKFDANLADELDDTKLNQIASDLLQGIDQDNQSRQDWLNTHAEGLKLLGLVIEDSRSDLGASSAPLEGMSTYRHPAVLKAVLNFQATARGELLPAAGPVKVRDDKTDKPPAPPMPPTPPAPPMIGHNGGPPMTGESPAMPPSAPPLLPPGVSPPLGAGAPGSPFSPPVLGATGMLPQEETPTERDLLANAFEKDFNHYLTATATEYYPDTVQMFFGVGFGGEGIKKVYNCPIRRRPVSESVPISDFIVSNALTNLGNAGRITHQTKMRPSTLRRMQLANVYRDIKLGEPTQADSPNAVDLAKANIVGVQPTPADPKDADYTILECYCELIIDEFAPRKFKGKGLPLPYRVTLEKDCRQILEIRRNWRESDEQCMAREFFVEFPYVKAFGFYGIGLLHILGNTTKALTAACRILLDSGMFANFPGFLYAKGAGRQNTNQFRVAPGTGVGLDIGLQSIKDAVSALPYKDIGPAFVAYIQHLEEQVEMLGGTAQTNVAEGRADAPVGTTLALIEQAMKPTGAVLKNMHTAQAKEFELLKDRFRDDPEAFWRYNPKPAMQWQKDQFIKALDDYDLVPVSDPNNPTELHRAMKGEWIAQKAVQAPGVVDPRKAFVRAAELSGISDPESLLLPPMPPQAPPVDPAKMAEVQLKAQGQKIQMQGKLEDGRLDLQKHQMMLQGDEAERASRERVAMIEQETERLRLASTLAIHSDKSESAHKALTMKILGDHYGKSLDREHEKHSQALDIISQHALQQQAQQAPEVEVPQ